MTCNWNIQGDLCSIILSCEILELLTEAPLIGLQLSTVDSLDSLCSKYAFLELFVKI